MNTASNKLVTRGIVRVLSTRHYTNYQSAGIFAGAEFKKEIS